MTAPVLICRVGSRRCALPLESVIETMRPLPLERLDAPHPSVLGVSVIRGETMPVVDTAALVGADGVEAGRFVTVRTGDHHIALAVDEVVSIEDVPDDVLHELPALFDGTDGAPIAALGALDTDLLVVLQAARLVPDTVWEQLAATTTAAAP